MAINIQQLLALLQQGAPQQGAVKPPMGGDPPVAPPPAATPPMPSPESPNPFPPKSGRPNPIEDLLGSMPKAPQPDLRAQLSARMPTTQPMGEKPLGMYSLAPDADSLAGPALTKLLGDPSAAEVMGIPSGMERAKPQPAAPRPSSGGGGQPGEGSLFQRLDAERGYTAEEKAVTPFQGAGPIASMFTDAASEVIQRGADSPDKADEVLRMEFQDDPEIESAIAQARARYDAASKRSAEGPGVMEYVGYVLATLAGANPMQAAEAISRRGEKRQDEQMALQDLLGAQGMKIKDRQMQRQEMGNQGIALERLMQQQQEGAMRQQNRAEDQNFERLKAGRGAALQRMNQLQQAVQYANNPAEKKALQDELNQLKRRTQFFGRQLGEPEKDEKGNPIGMASPDAMRLLGLG